MNNNKKFNYITIGNDCSPAAALRSLDIRDVALPFDWVKSESHIIENCIRDDFLNYHNNLSFNNNRTRLIDTYGIEFIHDYPLNDIENIDTNIIGEGVIGEENGKTITENWNVYYPIVKEKYNRRIQRFRDIMKESIPIIVLCRYNTNDVIKLHNFFTSHYNRNDIYFVNSCNEIVNHDNIINVNTEANGIWNDSSLWKNAIDKTIDDITILLTPEHIENCYI
jgi:hypothetical protein